MPDKPIIRLAPRTPARRKKSPMMQAKATIRQRQLAGLEKARRVRMRNVRRRRREERQARRAQRTR